MRSRSLLLLAGALGAVTVLTAVRSAIAQQTPAERIVRLADLEIDPAQLSQYKAALKQEIAASIRLEPGVLALYAVSVKDRPSQIRLFEMYASHEAYEAHLLTPHFRAYKTTTAGVVKSLTLVQTEPILLGAKAP